MSLDKAQALIAEAKEKGWKKLNLAGLGLTELPDELWELTQLEELILGWFDPEEYQFIGNNLTNLPSEIGELKSLTSLNLNSNQLSTLPEVIGELKSLTSLNLNSNQLSTLPEVIGELKSLTSLNLNSNQLSTLPEVIGELKHLTSLDLNSNQLSTLPEVIGELKSLTSLNLNSNQLSTLPEVIGELKSLTSLNLNSNQLSTLPEVIGELKHLTSLYLNSNQFSTLPEVIGELKHLTSLDLGGNQLSTLPEVIGELKSLTSLYLMSNQFSTLPEVIGELKHLTSLYLMSNQFSTLPEVIGELKHLTSLYLMSNQFSTLPEVIGELKHLTSLDLGGNQFSTLPEVIGELKHLTSLDLGGNQLSTLPEVIGELKHLTSLYLNSNQLSTLPEVIGELKHLTSLYLNSNQLSTLPEVIGELKSLTSLYLGGNQLSTLPEVIGELKSLTSLYLGGNQLSTLPEVIGKLFNLKELQIHENYLSQLCPEILNLSNLTKLSLDNNRFTQLPLELQQLSLEEFDLCGNPLPIPPEVLGPADQSWKNSEKLTEIFDFYQALQSETGTEQLFEAKLLVVGEGGAGKTSLAKKIKAPDYELKDSEESTQGIDVIRWDFPLDENTTFRVNIWDFGGQEIYHATHQFFLTERSLYALVADTRQENTDFYYWLKAIELLSTGSPVLIIKNEKQDRQCPINERQLRGEFDNLRETLATNLQDNRGLDEIKTAIQQYISRLPHVGTPLPKIWARVRSALENYARNRDHIPVQEYFELCRLNGLTDEAQMLQLSRYLHDLGVCLHFQKDKLLQRTVILNPEWGTTAVYKVLDNDDVRKRLGCFSDDNLESIWSDSKYSSMQVELLKLMMEFELCYEIPGRKGHYIAPQLLEKEQLEYDWDETDNLILRYQYEFKPKAIFPRLIVAMHEQIEQQTMVWKHGVILTDGWTRAEVIEEDRYYKAEIKIRVSGAQKKRLLFVVAHELEKINTTYKNLEYDPLIPCNCQMCRGSQSPMTYPLEKLQRFLRDHQPNIFCDQSYQMIPVRSLIDDVVEPQIREEARQEHRKEKGISSDVNQNPFLIGPPSVYLNFQPQLYQEQQNAPMTTVHQHGQNDNIAGDKIMGNKIEHQVNAPVADTPATAPEHTFPPNAVYISYAWGGASEELANRLDQTLQTKAIPLIRDKRDLPFKGRIKAFMEQIGRGHCVIVIISEKYLKSENCMFELIQIFKNNNFSDRIFPIVLEDANIYKPRHRLKYVKHWETEIADFEADLKEVSPANLDGFREDIDLYHEIRDFLPRLTNILKDMNTLTADIHTESGFAELCQAIEQTLG